jgi:thiamine kinase-like enzyme
MATDTSSQFSAKLELALGFRQVVQGDRANGQRHVSQALEKCPTLVGEIRHLIPDWVMNMDSGGESLIDQAHILLDVLPGNITGAGHLRRQVLSRMHLALAFEEYHKGHRSHIAKYILKGICYEPSELRNKGILSILMRSFLMQQTTDLHFEFTLENLSENIPNSLVNAIETAVKCRISNVERITNTKRKIYLIQAGKQEYILHLLTGGRDVLERKIVIANLVRETGIPVPAPLASSLSLPTAVDDPNWLLEEKMQGSSFLPWNMSQAEQLEAIAELGQYLRKLHNIRVQGFGQISSLKLDAPYPTFNTWLNKEQEAIAKACFMGDIPETTVLTLDGAYRFLQETYLEPPVLCHCELSFGNVLVTGGRVDALIDWESASGTDPAYDVAIFFATIGSYWYPMHDHSMLDAFMQAYGPDDPDNFYRRVIAHRLLFIASALTWIRREYGDKQYHLLKSIMSETSLN